MTLNSKQLKALEQFLTRLSKLPEGKIVSPSAFKHLIIQIRKKADELLKEENNESAESYLNNLTTVVDQLLQNSARPLRRLV